jgi:anaerobic ribonucleoside-triphosphate reductase activating protein
LDGVTISGGEPFEQAPALAELLDGLIEWRRETEQSIDILCYSGFPFARLQRDFSDILLRLDAIIPEPYVETLPDKALWRGSSNQTLVPLSDFGHSRYAPLVNAKLAEKGDFQVMVQADRVWFIGIPARGDMKKLEQACRSRGVIQSEVSWRA